MKTQPAVPLMIVDTNVYLRLYCSAVRPLLGATCGGYRWVITPELHQEFGRNQALVSEYAWMLDPVIEQERLAAVHHLPRNVRLRIESVGAVLRKQTAPLLQAESARRGISPAKTLSRADIALLATADLLDATIATDEWPLTYVAAQLSYPCCCSLDLVCALEQENRITADSRRALILDWIRNCERLPGNWNSTYRKLFNEHPPKVN